MEEMDRLEHTFHLLQKSDVRSGHFLPEVF